MQGYYRQPALHKNKMLTLDINMLKMISLTMLFTNIYSQYVVLKYLNQDAIHIIAKNNLMYLCHYKHKIFFLRKSPNHNIQ